MLNKREFCLREFIPIPFYAGDIFLRLNETRSLFYVNNSKTYNLRMENRMFCPKYGDFLGCNSLFEDNLSDTSICLSKLLLNSSDEYCVFVPVVEKNYFIELSDILLYVVVTKPIRVLIQCSYEENILDLIENQYISLKEGCTLFKHSDLYLNVSKLTTLDVLMSNMHPEIRFNATFPDNLDKIPILGQHDFSYEQAHAGIDTLIHNITVHEGAIDEMNLDISVWGYLGNIWSHLVQYFSNTLIKYSLTVVGVFISVYFCILIAKTMLRKMCEWRHTDV